MEIVRGTMDELKDIVKLALMLWPDNSEEELNIHFTFIYARKLSKEMNKPVRILLDAADMIKKYSNAPKFYISCRIKKYTYII